MKNRKTIFPSATAAIANPITETRLLTSSRHTERPLPCFRETAGSSAIRDSPNRDLLDQSRALWMRHNSASPRSIAQKQTENFTRTAQLRHSRAHYLFVRGIPEFRAAAALSRTLCNHRGFVLFRLPHGFKLALFGAQQRLRIQAMLFAIVFKRHLAVPPRPVHGIHVGIEEHLVEVPHNDGKRRQDRFVEVNSCRNVQPPAWQQASRPDFGPEHDA